MNTELTRRSLMKNITLGAGATLLAPVLADIAAHATGDAARANRRRIVFVMQSNGLQPDFIVPVGHRRNTTRTNQAIGVNDRTEEVALADRDLPAALEPLTPYKNRLALVQGLSGRIALSDHSCNHGALGCYPAGRVMGQTIDSALADALPGVFRHVLLGLGDSPTSSMNYAHSAVGPNRPLPTICSPDLAFRSLFGSVDGGSSRAAFDRQTNVLDFMADDIRRSRNALAGEEREKLDRYVESFETLHRRQMQIAAMQEDLRRNAPNLGDNRRATQSSLVLEAQFEIASAALIAGLTNVVTLTSGGGAQRFGSYPELGVLDQHHLGHGGAYAGKTNAEWFILIHQLHTRQIAEMARKLQAVPEGNGTMLDNTTIIFLSDSGDGHHPQLMTWPMVLLGNLGGRLRTAGRYLEFPRYGSPNHSTIASMYLTLLAAAGAPRDRFGIDDPGLRDVRQNGVLNELLA